MKLPPYETFPTLEADGLLLRSIQYADISNIVEISIYDGIQATSVEQAAAMQGKIDQDYQNGHSIHWGIVEKTSGRIVGTCGYYRGLDNGEGELGCVLLPQFRGQGFMTHALSLIIRFGLNHIGLKRIFAITTRQNSKAVQLLERLPFRKTGDLQNEEIVYDQVPGTGQIR